MHRLAHLAQVPRAAALAGPLLLVEVARVLAVLILLGRVLFIRSREPFERLVVILALLLGRERGTASAALAVTAAGATGATNRCLIRRASPGASGA
jgi:hypothetical protein